MLLIKPDDKAAQSLSDVPSARAYMDELLPMFSPSISDDALRQMMAKPPSRLPVFRYVGPRLHRKASTVLLGDAIHTVKPYFGLGVNSAFEDVAGLSQAIDTSDALHDALNTYSKSRGPEARALVELSRSFDRSGPLAFFTFILPLILDGLFSSAFPRLFAPNTLAMLQRVDLTFEAVRVRKRLDRAAQLFILGLLGVLLSKALLPALTVMTRSILSQGVGVGIGGPRTLLALVPLGAAVGFALRMRAKVGGDVADVLAAQKGSLGKTAEESQSRTEVEEKQSPAPAGC